jgi:hypothetical protein
VVAGDVADLRIKGKVGIVLGTYTTTFQIFLSQKFPAQNLKIPQNRDIIYIERKENKCPPSWGSS